LSFTNDTAGRDWRFCLAPMMDWSDRHCRYFWRLLTRRSRLYSEMVTTGAILRGDRDRFLAFNPEEQPLALQLGGNDPKALAECAKIAEDYGYDEVNLNCGCPSDRVQTGRIGACLMMEPNTVADCIAEMRNAVSIPVTIKHRTGVDDHDTEEHLHHFVGTIAQTGCQVFIVHARKAWLQGLSPKENREIPPLLYDRVRDLKQRFSNLTIVINGGITDLDTSCGLLENLDGVMMGREAYHNPFVLADVDQRIYGEPASLISRDDILEAFIPYCETQIAKGARLNHMARHILGLYVGQPGGKRFRRFLSENGTRADAQAELLLEAKNHMKSVLS
jgi:tRNA-dihydrouridine synthase A